MILSASRRTDIPAFFGAWFAARLDAGELYVRNPMNPQMVSRIILNPEKIDCIVFWTKNPEPFMPYLDRMDALGFRRRYFQVTLTPYGDEIERGLPPEGRRMDALINLSRREGKERVIWRYDPIILNERYPLDFHLEKFQRYCEKLSPYTEKCVVSFVDSYRYLAKNFAERRIRELADEEMYQAAQGMSGILKSGGFPLTLASCAERIDLEPYGIVHNKCVDGDLIKRLFGVSGEYKKDRGQRPECLCAVSRDIGAYNTCGHLCVYCYARRGGEIEAGDPASPILGRPLTGGECVKTIN